MKTVTLHDALKSFAFGDSRNSNDITDAVSNGSFVTQVNGNDLDLVYNHAVVPEPASLGVLSLGGIALLARRRRRQLGLSVQ